MDWVLDGLSAAGDAIYLALNGLSGRSALLDWLVALAIDNNLVKAGPVAAAFFFAWHAGSDGTRARARRVLIAPLVSLLFVLVTTKTLADSIFLPRPFVHSQQLYHLEGERLVESARIAYRQPGAGFSHGRFERLREGEIDGNDLNSFPSDHAGFYFALALGILLANRAAGILAIAWTLIVICGSRIVTGTHSVADIAAGLAVGGSILLAVQLAATRWIARPFDATARWTMRREALSSAGLFLVLFEVANTLDNIREVLRAVKRAMGL